MKKIAFVLAAVVMIASCQRSVEPKQMSFTESFANKVEMNTFIKQSADKIRDAGWKYYALKVRSIDTLKSEVTVIGAMRLDPSWSDCGPVYYGGTVNNGSVLMNANAMYDMYLSQGYNCVCMNSWNVPQGGEWGGNQTCASVTASVTTECPCLMGLEY